MADNDSGIGGEQFGEGELTETTTLDRLAAEGIVRPDMIPAMLPFLAESVCIYDARGELMSRIAPPGGILGHGLGAGASLYGAVHDDDLPMAIQLTSAIRDSEPGWGGQFQMRLWHADGSCRPYEIRAFNRHDDPAIGGFVICVRETASMSAAPIEGLEHDDLASSMVAALPTATLVIDLWGRVRNANTSAAELLDCSPDDLVGVDLALLADGTDRVLLRCAVQALLREPGQRVVVFTHRPGPLAERNPAGGRVIEAHLHAQGRGGRSSLLTVVLSDRTDEPELVRLATRDDLTDLANRACVVDALEGLLAADAPEVSVLYCDVDRLKELNDTHGHEAGDRALVAIADELRKQVRPNDVVGRIGGDEFVILCPELDLHGAETLAGRLSEDVVVRDPAWAQPLKMSFGAAAARPGDAVADVLRRADQRMFEAKRSRASTA